MMDPDIQKGILAALERMAAALERLANTVIEPREGFPSIRVTDYPKTRP